MAPPLDELTVPHDVPDDERTAVWLASPLAILTTHGDGVVASVNPAGLQFFRCEPAQLLGLPLESLAHPMDRATLRDALARARAGARPPRMELRFLCVDATELVGGFSVAPLTNGRDARCVCVVRDLSAERALRPTLLHTERLASLGAVAATVAHELNNPLMGVRACLQLLAATASHEQAELVQMACAEIDRAGTIVDDLRRYARRQDDQRRTLRPTDLVDRLLRMRRLGRPDDALRLTVEVSETLPMVHGDEGQLQQALSNLLRNAEQAVASMPAARRAVALRARAVDDVLVFEVEDRGVGVSDEVRPRLFDPFFSTKPVGEGTGLGLTVVQSIAEGHGGRVELVDTPGGGATFRLWLPCAPGEGTARAERAPALRAAAVRGLRVLLADDEPVLRAAMRRLGAMQGMQVTVAEDATEALAALNGADFDVVLLDVIMPGGGGLAVLREMQARRPALTSRALLLSGETGDALRGVEGLTLPPLLRKPFDLNDLLGWIERLGRGVSAQPASR